MTDSAIIKGELTIDGLLSATGAKECARLGLAYRNIDGELLRIEQASESELIH
jgi:hypothetical protein